MLKKFLRIDNLGLLHDSGNSPTFSETTLIFAENGRGKSTLCSLLRSLEKNYTSELPKRQTVDQQGSPEAQIVFDGGPAVSLLQSGQWDHPRPHVRVFDTTFVRANVHSGHAVEAGHRRSLLQFALGDSAVGAAEEEAEANAQARLIRERIRAHEDALEPLHAGITLTEFAALPEVVDIDVQIQTADAEIRATESVAAILQRPSPVEIDLVDWDPEDLISVLRRDIGSVSETAEALAKAHISRIDVPDVEAWIRTGQAFEKDALCPYCAQGTDHSDLLAAFRALFTEEYGKLVAHVDDAAARFGAATSGQAFAAVLSALDVQNARITAWVDVIAVEAVSLPQDALSGGLAELRGVVDPVIASKRASPTASTPAEAIAEFSEAVAQKWSLVRDLLTQLNTDVRVCVDAVAAYKTNLGNSDLKALKERRASLVRSRTRHREDVVLIVDALAAERTALTAAVSKAEKARDTVRALMNATLAEYQVKINALLIDFGADFQIEQMKANFRGDPQSEYRINLRNASVPLQHDTGPDFDAALSYGDKRTLAFAFFAASVLNDPSLSSQIIVIDDPMSSLDRNRQECTMKLLCAMSDGAMQLIVTGHDATFLRHVQKRIGRSNAATQIAEIRLERSAHGYSKWAAACLEALCESEWLTKYREVAAFIDGSAAVAPRIIATHIRPVLERHLHRRFPRHIPEGLMLGQVLTLIRDAAPPSPLVYASESCDELAAINDYAGKFHHDTNPGLANSDHVADQEVLSFARRAMDLVHGRPPTP